MRTTSFIACAAIALCGAAHASQGWKLAYAESKMLDKKVPYATIDAKAPSRGIEATLHMSCERNIPVPPVNLLLSSLLTQGRVLVTFRVDEREPETHGSFVGSSGQTVRMMGFNGGLLRHAHRFRVKLVLFGMSPLFFDFDVRGAEKALAALNCGHQH